MFDYKIIAYNKLGKVRRTKTSIVPDEGNDVMYTMSEQCGYAEALDNNVLAWVIWSKPLSLEKNISKELILQGSQLTLFPYNKDIHKTNFKIMLPQVQRFQKNPQRTTLKTCHMLRLGGSFRGLGESTTYAELSLMTYLTKQSQS